MPFSKFTSLKGYIFSAILLNWFPLADAASDYIGKSLNQIVKGNFTDDVTLLGTAGEIVLGIFDLDLVCDLRDITYDIGEWGEIIIGDDEFSWSFAGQSFLDLVGIVPVIGAVKYSATDL